MPQHTPNETIAQQIVENVPVIVLVLDAEGRVEYANPCFEELTGRPLEAVRGRDWFETFLPVRDRAPMRRFFAEALTAGEVHRHVNPVLVGGGRERQIEWHARTLRDADGEPTGVACFGTDVTDERRAARVRRAAERDALESAQRESATLRALLEAFPGQAALYTRDGRFVAANRSTLAMSDRPPGSDVAPWELSGFDAVLAGFDRSRIREAIGRAAAGETARFDVRYRDGREVEASFCPVFDESGEVTHVAAFGVEVTERNRALGALERSEARLREAQRLAGLGSWELDVPSGRLRWSEELYRIFEVDPSRPDFSFEDFLERVHPDDREAVVGDYRRSVEERTDYGIEHRLLLPDGRVKHIRERGRTEYDAEGRPVRSAGTAQDITAEVAAEKRLRRILDGLFTFVGLFDRDGTTVEVNRAPLDLAGLRREDVLGKPLWEAYWWSYAHETQAQIRRALERAARGEIVREDFTARIGEDEHIVVDVMFGPLVGEDGELEGVIASAVDITDRVRAEAEAHRASALLRTVVEGAPVLLFAIEPDGTFSLSEGRALETLGLAPGEVVGRSALELYGDVEGFPDAFRRALAGEQVSLLGRLGDVFFEGLYAPRFDREGRVDGVVGVGVDVTERVRQEARIADQLAEKEVLLREIHHRVKNNLQVISSLLHFQAKKARSPEDAAAFEEGRNRLFAMILVHEKLYRSQDLSRVDLGEYVRSLVAVLVQSMPARDRVEVNIEADDVKLPIETALPSGMVLAELLTNVFKYAFPDGRSGTARVGVSRQPGRVRLEVRDDGVGLPAGFDPRSARTFGWQLVRTLTLQLDGELEVDGTDGVRVRVSFPVEPAEPVASAAGRAEA